MFTASAKKKENIAEYLLYMWQIEDSTLIAYAPILSMPIQDSPRSNAHSSMSGMRALWI